MKKKLIIILGVCLALVFAFSACTGSYRRKGVEGGPAASDPVVNNGSMIVSKGDYYYFINGKAGQSDLNTYDKVVKGAIMRCKKADLYDSSKHEVIVPKIVLSSYAETGFFIYGDNIYFASPNADKDKDGNVQYTYLDFMKSKLNGESAERLMIKSSASMQHRFYEKDGKVSLVFVDESKVQIMDCATKAVTDLVSEYTGTPIFLSNGKVIYTANVYYNLISQAEEADVTYKTYTENSDKYGISKYNKVISTDVFSGEHTVLAKDSDNTKTQYSYALSKSEISFGTEYVYFTRSEIAGGKGEQGTFRTTAATLSIKDATLISKSTSVGTFLTAPNGNGYIMQDAAAIVWYKNVFGSDGTLTAVYTKPLYKIASTTLFTIRQEGNQYYLYYFNSGALERITLPGSGDVSDSDIVLKDDAANIKILGSKSIDTMGTDWIKPVYMDGKWFFFNSASNAFNSTGDVKDDEMNQYKHVDMYLRSGYLFTAVEVTGEDYEDRIVPPVRVSKLSDEDKETEKTRIEEENENRDKNRAAKFDETAKKVFGEIPDIDKMKAEDVTQAMKDMITEFNALSKEIREFSNYKKRIAKLETKLKELNAIA